MLATALLCNILLCAVPQSQPAAGSPTVTALEILETRQIRLKGKADADGPRFSFNRPGLKLVVEVQGADVARASQFGMLEITSAIDDRGGKLKLNEEAIGFHDFRTEFVPIDREQMFLGEEKPPKDVIRIEIPLDPPARSAATISVRGKLMLKRAETVEVLVPVAPGEVKHEQLEKLGAKLKIIKGEEPNTFAYELSGKLDALLDARLVDASGKEFETNGSSTLSDGETLHREIAMEKAPPSDAKLKLTLVTKAENVPVSFELKDLKLP